jgi:nitric oxide synthase oxygenase domain/subunit
MKGTGFKDKKTAVKTIKIIRYRSLTYQYNVINTMFNRAKFHPHQTSEMRDAMKIFAGWLKKYNKPKIKYAYMSKADIIASGVKSDFIDKLEEVGWKYYKLQYLPIGANGKYDYLSWRDIQIEKLLGKSSKKKLLEFAYLF